MKEGDKADVFSKSKNECLYQASLCQLFNFNAFLQNNACHIW